MLEPEVETPVAEEETPEATPSQEGDPENPTKDGEGKEVEEKETVAEEKLPKGFEKLEDGRYAFKTGGSTYYGKTQEEAWDNALEGIKEKDTIISTLKGNKEFDDVLGGDKGKAAALPDPPDEDAFLSKEFSARSLDVKMAKFSDADFDNYQQEHGLTDRQMARLEQQVNEARQTATRQFKSEDVRWLNTATVNQELSPAIRQMIQKSGVDAKAIAAEYQKALSDPKNRDAEGYINTPKIILAMFDKVLDAVKPKVETETKKQLAQREAELAERKRNLQASNLGGGKGSAKGKPPANIKEGGETLRKMIGSGQI